jgi:hypothetical protein
MKKMLLLVLFGFIGLSVFAQEEKEWERYPYTLGGGLEMNMNSRSGWAQGYSVIMDRHLFDEHFTAGVRGTMNSDYKGITNLEGTLFARLFPFKMGLGGAFVQLGWGITSFTEDELRPLTFTFDFSAGFRYFFLKGFYAEAYIRTGYPVQWAGGILGGHRFSF